MSPVKGRRKEGGSHTAVRRVSAKPVGGSFPSKESLLCSIFGCKQHVGSREGNGTPLRCSCLENPRDGGAWWAAIYGVAQSQTRLKRLSSSSSNYSVSWCDPLLADLVWDFLCFLDRDTCSFPRLGKFLVIISTQTPLSLSSFRHPYNMNVSMLLVPVVSLNYPHFILFLISFSDFHYCVFQFTHLFLSYSLLLIPSSLFFISGFFLFGCSLYVLFVKHL